MRSGFLGVGQDAGAAVFIKTEMTDRFCAGGGFIEILARAHGSKSGVHEAIHDAGHAVIDFANGKRATDGMDVFDDGILVLWVDKGDEGMGGKGAGRTGPGAQALPPGFVVEAEFFAVDGRHGAAGSADGEVSAARD